MKEFFMGYHRGENEINVESEILGGQDDIVFGSVVEFSSWAHQLTPSTMEESNGSTSNPIHLRCIVVSPLLRKAASIALENKKRGTISYDNRCLYCPFYMLSSISKVAYKLEPLLEVQIHSTFHVFQLKKCLSIPSERCHVADDGAPGSVNVSKKYGLKCHLFHVVTNGLSIVW
ncbi:hypothetical protein NE237_029863 [Protea cynaroides]|uniref:Uncharacterized protein n=1 Tax=Protea cynaroides TaxID=273540 RepID=A0A9Q0GRY5_9MAGN|nr:hypothetical protein NE237_029863 [Protea cynaroides]